MVNQLAACANNRSGGNGDNDTARRIRIYQRWPLGVRCVSEIRVIGRTMSAVLQPTGTWSTSGEDIERQRSDSDRRSRIDECSSRCLQGLSCAATMNTQIFGRVSDDWSAPVPYHHRYPQRLRPQCLHLRAARGISDHRRIATIWFGADR